MNEWIKLSLSRTAWGPPANKGQKASILVPPSALPTTLWVKHMYWSWLPSEEICFTPVHTQNVEGSVNNCVCLRHTTWWPYLYTLWNTVSPPFKDEFRSRKLFLNLTKWVLGKGCTLFTLFFLQVLVFSWTATKLGGYQRWCRSWIHTLRSLSISSVTLPYFWGIIIGTANSTWSMILSLFFRIVPMTYWFML